MTVEEKAEQHVGLIFQHVARLRTKLYDRLLVGQRLTSAQVYVVNHLMREDGLTQVELAKLVGIGTVSMSGLIDRLEARGWVVRKPDPRDRRSKQVWLMPIVEGKKEMLGQIAKHVNDTSMEGLSPEEIELFLQMMRRVRINLVEKLNEH